VVRHLPRVPSQVVSIRIFSPQPERCGLLGGFAARRAPGFLAGFLRARSLSLAACWCLLPVALPLSSAYRSCSRSASIKECSASQLTASSQSQHTSLSTTPASHPIPSQQPSSSNNPSTDRFYNEKCIANRLRQQPPPPPVHFSRSNQQNVQPPPRQYSLIQRTAPGPETRANERLSSTSPLFRSFASRPI